MSVLMYVQGNQRKFETICIFHVFIYEHFFHNYFRSLELHFFLNLNTTINPLQYTKIFELYVKYMSQLTEIICVWFWNVLNYNLNIIIIRFHRWQFQRKTKFQILKNKKKGVYFKCFLANMFCWLEMLKLKRRVVAMKKLCWSAGTIFI